MIERYSGQQQIVCECGASQPRTYQSDEFDVMVSDARHHGWSIQRLAGEWTHTCPDCVEAARRKPQGRLL
ncbi:hypothetical protein P9279_21870 [Mesorhizobium sp. WSM4962]|uniref:hypothetical protein n=1 Tax=Mesorhizobium sp. WSM4962 TaxID=3038548 RepID=UPI002417017A|nr:hypothetical protein [Mesorhizobium sp. WSM4962]MDG4903160.1 hypothetical protein [Mesorhizobium sp. WSM4962]